MLRGVPIPLETIKNLEAEHGGKVVLNDTFAAYLETILKWKKRANPDLAIKSMSTPVMATVYYVPVEIKIDPFHLGIDSRSGYHIFVECRRGFVVK